MKVIEMLDQKYREKLKTMHGSHWDVIKRDAAARKVHPAEIMYMALEITHNDIKQNGGYTGELWEDIQAMREAKLMASNANRQYSGHVTKYWLTKRGWMAINKNHAIC